MWKYLPFIRRRPTWGYLLSHEAAMIILSSLGRTGVDCLKLLPPSVNEMEIRYVRGNNTRAWTNDLKRMDSSDVTVTAMTLRMSN